MSERELNELDSGLSSNLVIQEINRKSCDRYQQSNFMRTNSAISGTVDES